MALDTRVTRNPAELDAIYRFRLHVYYNELGARLPESVIRTGHLSCDLDAMAYQYATFENGEVVGCVRVVDLKDIKNERALIGKYRLERVIEAWGVDVITVTGRMAIAEKYRKHSIVHRLMAMATDEARRRGIRLAFLDCSPHLLPFYEAFGFRRYAPAFSDPVFGFKQPLVFMLRDKKDLKEVGSPLAHTSHYEDDPEVRAWYAEHYQTYASPRTATLLPCGAFTDLVERLVRTDILKLPIFRDLSRKEIDLALKKSTVVSASPGDMVIRSGLRDEYLCVVLSGRLESHYAGCHLDTLARGVLCGETEFLTRRERLVEVVACEPTELLILPTEYLRQLIERDVAIGLRLMKNLAVGIATRMAKRMDTAVTSAGPSRLEMGAKEKQLTM
jgi:predicted GNAT family N-acyltransferase